MWPCCALQKTFEVFQSVCERASRLCAEEIHLREKASSLITRLGHGTCRTDVQMYHQRISEYVACRICSAYVCHIQPTTAQCGPRELLSRDGVETLVAAQVRGVCSVRFFCSLLLDSIIFWWFGIG